MLTSIVDTKLLFFTGSEYHNEVYVLLKAADQVWYCGVYCTSLYSISMSSLTDPADPALGTANIAVTEKYPNPNHHRNVNVRLLKYSEYFGQDSVILRPPRANVAVLYEASRNSTEVDLFQCDSAVPTAESSLVRLRR